jgi:hypothetical protein
METIMAIKPQPDNEWLRTKIYKIEEELRWCNMHPRDVTFMHLKQLKRVIDEAHQYMQKIGGKMFEDFNHFKSQFEFAMKNFNNLKPSQLQQFEEMIQVIIKDL